MRSLSLLAIAAAGTTLFVGPASAQVIFADTFNRADSPELDLTLDGITDNTGASLAPGSVYVTPFEDPEGDNDGDPSDAGLNNIGGNNLNLAVGVGTSNAYVNHNFLNSSLFSVSLDVVAYPQTAVDFGGAFAIGMSQEEADSAGDAATGHPIGGDETTPGPKMTEAFPFRDENEGSAVSDFWVALRGDNSVAWGGFGDENVLGSADVGAKTGTISATFIADDFTAGSTVDYVVSFNGTPVTGGTGSFTWSGTDENFIGIDARGGGVALDNFSVNAIPEPASLSLLGAAGLMSLRRRRA